MVIDTREQKPLAFGKMKTCSGTLPTGDYSIKGLEKVICVERKSLSDFLSCVGAQRKRFDQEIQRMRGYEARCIVVEAPKSSVLHGDGRCKVHPHAVEGSIVGWNGQIHIEFAMGREAAAKYVAWFLWLHAKRRFEEIKGML